MPTQLGSGPHTQLSGAVEPVAAKLHKPKHHLFSNKPATGDGHTSLTEPPPSPTPAHGLRAQLHHLLPRHAFFHVRVHIHQLASVPLVGGEFGLRWKFKNVHTLPGSKPGLLGIVKCRSARRKDEKGKGKEDDVDSLGSGETHHDARSVSEENHPQIPSVVVSGHENHSPTSSYKTRSPSIGSASSSPTMFSQQRLSTDSSSSPSLLAPSTTTSRTAFSQATGPLSASTPLDSYAPARGMTPFVALRDHKVTWEHTVDIVVRMDVDRDTLTLLPNELKLVVMQRVLPDDPYAPHNPRLGALYLNLAEYASAGEVTRRYLLSQSKTNATLKLTIQLEHVAGEAHYNAPPLPKGEILNGISGLLESDVYRTRPRPLDLYGPYSDQEDLELDLRGDPEEWGDEGGVPFDVERLPLAYGPKTTETLIEAIFNPVRTSEKRRESPFTYYVSPEDAGAMAGMPKRNASGAKAPSLNGGGSLHAAEVASIYSTGSSNEDAYASVHTSNSGHSVRSGSSQGFGDVDMGGLKGWWRKVASRPGTPTPVR